MAVFKKIAVLFLVAVVVGCNQQDDEASLHIFSQSYDFNQSVDGWLSDFTDYPVGENIEADSIYRWQSEYVSRPGASNGSKALMLSCNNLNGDIFMFLKRKIDGLRANTNYRIVYEIELATNVPAGQGVILKAGASDLEPKKIIENNYYSLNIDKGYHTGSGENLASLGDIGISAPNVSDGLISKDNASAYQPMIVRSNSKGEIWLIVGTDSLYEGINTVYYSKVNVVFSVSN